MKCYDITKDLFTKNRAPACPKPRAETIMCIADGDCCNYSVLTASVHASTHCDATLHFVDDGVDICQMPLTHYLGECYVMSVANDTILMPNEVDGIPIGTKRLLIKGGENTFLSEAAAVEIGNRGIITVGTEAFSVGMGNEDTSVHVALLRKGVAIIENLNLRHILPGRYFLSAAPCRFSGLEAAFCRAVLMDIPSIDNF